MVQMADTEVARDKICTDDVVAGVRLSDARGEDHCGSDG